MFQLNNKNETLEILTKYFTLKDVSKISTKKLVLFFSTNKGILTSLDCKKHGLGGTLLFAC